METAKEKNWKIRKITYSNEGFRGCSISIRILHKIPVSEVIWLIPLKLSLLLNMKLPETQNNFWHDKSMCECLLSSTDCHKSYHNIEWYWTLTFMYSSY